jgi:hypothetical protein
MRSLLTDWYLLVIEKHQAELMVVLLTKYKHWRDDKIDRELTRRVTVAVFVKFDWKFDGRWIDAFPTCSIDLLDKDLIVVVSNETNNDGEFIAICCPIFKWISRIDVISAIVAVACWAIWLACSFRKI